MNKIITIAEKYNPAMEMTDPEEARKYFVECVKHTMSFGHSFKEAVEIEKTNIAYVAGYSDNETRLRVEELFHCQHPFFGKAEDGIPTAEEAIETGIHVEDPNWYKKTKTIKSLKGKKNG